MLELISHRSVNGLKFGDLPQRADEIFGKPSFERYNRSDGLVKHYRDVILTFDGTDQGLQECTIPRDVPTRLNDWLIEWTPAGLLSLCQEDGNPFELSGIVVLFLTGISLSGLEEDDYSNRSLTLFAPGARDDLRAKMKPFKP